MFTAPASAPGYRRASLYGRDRLVGCKSRYASCGKLKASTFDKGPAAVIASTRRLAAILAADVVGYSRLMSADEEGTHERLKTHLRELFDPKIREHQGRVVKNTGDGLLVEFAIVVDALRCATEVQAGMAESNAPITDDRRIEFRIGIHQGDIVIEEHDIFGDAVNIAARLESLAQPGGSVFRLGCRSTLRASST